MAFSHIRQKQFLRVIGTLLAVFLLSKGLYEIFRSNSIDLSSERRYYFIRGALKVGCGSFWFLLQLWLTITESDKIEHIFIFGNGALIPCLGSKLASQFSANVVIANPFESISVNSKHFNLKTLKRLGPLLTTVIGLAARRFDYN